MTQANTPSEKPFLLLISMLTYTLSIYVLLRWAYLLVSKFFLLVYQGRESLRQPY